jgi:NAD(P)H-hydrate epimerase
MAGVAALRSGAGLVTVASTVGRFAVPELMTSALPRSWEALRETCERKTVLAIGPGLGMSDGAVAMARSAVAECDLPMVVDADALNALARHEWKAGWAPRVLTPHPGEMSRLAGVSTHDVQENRLHIARQYAAAHNCTVVLKGYRTVVAIPDGRVWVNPTGTPALAKGGTGDVLTGMLAGLIAQWPKSHHLAVIAGVYLHGLAAQKAENEWGERCMLATDLLEFLPEAIRECARLANVI